MDSKSQLTVDIIAKVSEGKIDIVNAAKLLNKSRRTIERYLRRYREIGIQFVVHQNVRKTPANKTCDKLKHQVQRLIKGCLKPCTWIGLVSLEVQRGVTSHK